MSKEINFSDRTARFVITGVVHKAFAASNGKFGKLTVLVPNKNGKDCRHEIKSFDTALVQRISEIGAGQSVRCAGVIELECLKNKDKTEIKVDGYSVWIQVPILRTLDIEEMKTPPSISNPFDDNGGLPF